MTNPPVGFAEALAAMPSERFTAFVVDLWAARGRSVTREGPLVRTSEATGDGERYLFARAADDTRPIPADADVIVCAGQVAVADADRTVLGPADLYELVRYALDRPTSERLARDHLGGPHVLERAPVGDGEPDDEVEPDDGDGDTASEREGRVTEPDDADGDPTTEREGRVVAPRPNDETGRLADTQISFLAEDDADEESPPTADRSPTRRTLLLAAGAFLAGLGTAVASGVGPFAGDEGSDDADSGVEPSPTPTPDRIPVAGLSADGVSEPEALATGHVDRLEGTSFTIASTKTVHAADGRLRSSLAVETHLAESGAFHSAVATAGPDGRPLFGELGASAELWSDGETYLRRVSADDGTRYTEYMPGLEINEWFLWSNIIPFGGQPYSSRVFYRDLFEAVPVSVVTEGAPPYRLFATDRTIEGAPLLFDPLDSGAPIEDVDVVATVTRPGLIRTLDLQYAGPDGDTRLAVRWSINYRGLGETTVERPAWADRALE